MFMLIFELLLTINVHEMNVCVLGNGFFPGSTDSFKGPM